MSEPEIVRNPPVDRLFPVQRVRHHGHHGNRNTPRGSVRDSEFVYNVTVAGESYEPAFTGFKVLYEAKAIVSSQTHWAS